MERERFSQVNNAVIDIIAPRSIELSRNTIRYNDLWAKTLIITGYTTPKDQNESLFAAMDFPGVISSVHVQTDRKPNQKFFLVTAALMVLASSVNELERKCQEIIQKLAAQNIKAQQMTREEALLSVSPYGLCPKSIKSTAKSWTTSLDMALAFPCNKSTINDEKGFIFGKNSNSEIILINQWKKTGNRQNANWLISGRSKKQAEAINHILLNEFSQGARVVIVDLKQEYGSMCQKLGGQIINISDKNVFKQLDEVTLFVTSDFNQEGPNTQTQQLLNLLNWLWQQIVKNPGEKIILYINDLSSILSFWSPQVQQCLGNLANLSQTCNFSLIVGISPMELKTDNVNHDLKELLKEFCYKFFVSLDRETYDRVATWLNLNLSDSDYSKLEETDYGILSVGHDQVIAKTEVFAFEKEFF